MNAKYNEHVVKFGTFDTETRGEDQRIVFVRRYSKMTITCTIIVFIGITILFILKATVPQVDFDNDHKFLNWIAKSNWFEEAYNVNIYVYFSWQLFESTLRVVIAVIYFRALWIISKIGKRSQTSRVLFLHALIMLLTILADVTCTGFVVVTASKQPTYFFQGIVITYILWRLFDSIQLMFVLIIASQFTNYFIARERKKREEKRKAVHQYIMNTVDAEVLSEESDDLKSHRDSIISDSEENIYLRGVHSYKEQRQSFLSTESG